MNPKGQAAPRRHRTACGTKDRVLGQKETRDVVEIPLVAGGGVLRRSDDEGVSNDRGGVRKGEMNRFVNRAVNHCPTYHGHDGMQNQLRLLVPLLLVVFDALGHAPLFKGV